LPGCAYSVSDADDDRQMMMLLAVSAVSVEVVSTHHDWLDYVAALGGLAGGIAGVVALIFAARSAGDASRSATASVQSAGIAAESLTILRQEAQAAQEQRSRRAELVPSMRVVSTERGGGHARVVLELRVDNVGTRAASRLSISVGMPPSLRFVPSKPDGSPEDDGQTYVGSWGPTGETVVRRWDHDLGPLNPGAAVGQILVIDHATPGQYAIGVGMIHEDRHGTIEHVWELIVPASGNARLLPVTGEDASSPQA
jgi:hypothetical protein